MASRKGTAPRRRRLSSRDGIIEAADWNGATGDAYPRGTLMSTFDGGATWQSFADEGFDVHFRTFVIPN